MDRDRKEAQAFYDDYRESFKTLISYLEKVKETATKTGFTETLFGRRRNISLIRSGIPFLRAQGERMAINAPIQGTAADMLRLSLIEIQENLKLNFKEKAVLIMQVHDEIILECELGFEEKASIVVREIMENILIKNKDKFIFDVTLVPIEVSIKKGFKWGDLK
jgi:DNA polymerase-1